MDIDGVIYCSKCMRQIEEEGICPHCGYEPDIDVRSRLVLEQGTLLNDRYQLGAVIGRGGFGITYAAWDETLGMPVAIKEYFPGEYVQRDTDEADDVIPVEEYKKEYAIGLSRFVRESQVLAMLHDIPGIVKVLDCFGENGTHYIAMEYIRGVEIDRYVQEKKLTSQQVIELMRQPVEALMAAHRQGVLHRDITPGNILVQEDGEVRLIDFGAAAQEKRQKEGKDKSIILTEKYAAIEQYESGLSQGPWTDVYGLSATLYTVLAGVNPPASVQRTLIDEIVPINKKCGKLKKYQSRAIMEGLTVQPEKRIRSMEEFRSILYDLPLPEEIQRHKRMMRRLYAVAAAVIAVIAIAMTNFLFGLPLGDGLWYTLSADGFRVVRNAGDAENISVPEKRLWIPVTSLDADVFANDGNIRTVALPSTIAEIEDTSFLGCANLETVSISEGTERIGAYAFADCASLHTVYMPESVEEIDSEAFANVPVYMTLWSMDGTYARVYADENGIGWTQPDMFGYSIEDGYAVITACNSEYVAKVFDDEGNEVGISVYVPSYIDGLPVTAFSTEEQIFPDDLVEVRLPERLEVLPKGLLTGKALLENVNLGSSLVEIEDEALMNTRIQQLELPATLKKIGSYSFAVMPIKELVLPEGLEYIGDHAFTQSHIARIEIPDTVTTVGEYAFATCINLEYVKYSAGAEEIPVSCFTGCKSLEEVKLPQGSLKVVNWRAFEKCESLKVIALPDGVETINIMAFKYCTDLKIIRLPKSLGNDSGGNNPDRGIAVNAFIGCPNDMLIVGGADTIAERAGVYFEYPFEAEYKLRRDSEFQATLTGGLIANEDVQMEYTDTFELPSVYYTSEDNFVPIIRVTTGDILNARCLYMPDRLEVISTAAFADVQGLEEVRMNHVEVIETMAFWNCHDLSAIDLPEGLVKIEDSAFEECVNLTNVVLPESLEKIGGSAFLDCESITSINIPSNLVWLPEACFGRTSITEVTIPGNVTTVTAAFYECEKLESVVAEEGVRVFEASFYGCSSLKSVVLPESTEWVSQMVFAGCTQLEDVWVYSMDVNWDYYDLIYVRELNGFDRETNTLTDYEDIVLESFFDESRHVFSDCPNVTIHAYPGSTAEAYANEHGIRFEPIEVDYQGSFIDGILGK